MWFFALLTIAVPAVLLPFSLRRENAYGTPAARSETAVVRANTNPLWDDRLNAAPRFLKAGTTEPALLSRTNVTTPVETGIESAKPAPDSLDLARNLDGLGVAAWERGDLAKAKEYHRQALEIRQRLAPGSLDLAESYNHLGDAEQELGHLATAEKYEHDALAIREKLSPDSLAVAETLHSLGRVTMDRGDLAKAEEYYRASLDLRLKLAPGSRDLALSFIGLANLCARRGDLTGQEGYLHQASRLEEKLTPADRATILQGLGGAYLQRGQPQKAEEYFRQALEIRQKFLPNSLELAISLSRMGDLNANRGDPEQAERYFRQALEIRQTVAPESLAVASSLSNLGAVVQTLGNLAEAEKCFRRALAIQQQLAPASLPVAGSLHSLAIISWLREDLTNTEDYLRRALEIRRRLAPEGAVMAQTLNWLGLVAARRGDLERAAEYDHQALDISEKLSRASLLDAELLSNLGDIAKRRAKLAQADTYYRQALTIQHKIAPDSPTEAGTLQKLGELARNRKDFAEAEKCFRQVLAIREQKIPGTLAHANVLIALASLLRQRDQTEAASHLYEEAISMLDNQMAHLGGSDDVRSSFRAEYESKYQDYIDLLVADKKPELAFDVVERSRARTLLELLDRGRIDIRQGGGDPELLQREHSLRESISAKSSYRLQLLDAGNSADKLAEIDRQTAELREQYEEVKTQLQIDSPGYSALMQPKPLSVEEVQHLLLDENTVLLEYSLGEKRSYVWAVTPTSAAVYGLPPRKTIEDAARNTYELLTARGRRIDKETIPARKLRLAQAEAEYTKVATELSQMILGPAATMLEKKRLLIVGDGALQYLPYAALPTPRVPVSSSIKLIGASPALKEENLVPLIAEHEIVSLPSASALGELRRASANRKEPPKAVAVLADPVFDRRDERVAASHVGIRRAKQKVMDLPLPDGDSAQRLTRSATDVGLIKGRMYLSRLLWTQREAAAILGVTPAGQGMEVLGFDANRANALSPTLGRYRVVHFATHALLDSKNPELSGLVLSLVDRHGQPQNGFLDLDQIYNLNLPVDLVVLSACDTGLGKEIRGEGLIGLSRGFMYAGATRVMASLWSVDDEVTSELMARFYKSLEQGKMSPAAALRSAQMEVAKEERWSSPYYWAGFQIQGEWK